MGYLCCSDGVFPPTVSLFGGCYGKLVVCGHFVNYKSLRSVVVRPPAWIDLFTFLLSKEEKNGKYKRTNIMKNNKSKRVIHAKIISVDDISPSPDHLRIQTAGSIESLEELSSSIKEKGIIHPLVVWEHEKGKYQLLCGHRRIEGAKLANMTEVPCFVEEKKLTDTECIEIMLVENIQREDLNPFEEIRAYQKLIKKDLKQKDIAKKVSKSESHISRALSIPKQFSPEEWEEFQAVAMSQENLTFSTLYEVRNLNTFKEKVEAILSKKTVNELREESKNVEQEKKKDPNKDIDEQNVAKYICSTKVKWFKTKLIIEGNGLDKENLLIIMETLSKELTKEYKL